MIDTVCTCRDSARGGGSQVEQGISPTELVWQRAASTSAPNGGLDLLGAACRVSDLARVVESTICDGLSSSFGPLGSPELWQGVAECLQKAMLALSEAATLADGEMGGVEVGLDDGEHGPSTMPADGSMAR